MALTPEDIFNKRFSSTRIREGYDQDEVDDFLDEVLADYRSALELIEDLKQRLVAKDSRIAELQRQAAAVTTTTQNSADQGAESRGTDTANEALSPYPTAKASSDLLKPDEQGNLLQLARKLHEEHVQEGIQKRDSLIAEGHAAAARIVQDAEAPLKSRIAKLEDEASVARQRILELQDFEKQYRRKLRELITNQLNQLDGRPSNTSESE